MSNEEIIIIDESRYINLLKMLCSSKEDQLIALNTISHLDLKANLVQTALLRKEGHANYSDWVTHCPSVVQYHNFNGLPQIVDHSSVYNLFSRSGITINREAKIIFLKRYVKLVEEVLGRLPIVAEIQINIKIKDDE